MILFIIFALLLPLLTFGSPVLAQVIIDFQSQPTSEQLVQVIKSATRGKNYATVLRVANNAIKQLPDVRFVLDKPIFGETPSFSKVILQD